MSEKSSIKALIIDDSKQARKLLRLMLFELANDFQVIGEAEDAEEGLFLIRDKRPDVIFLDIEMPGKSGIQLAEQLIHLQLNTKIIFTTAYNEYAIKAFRLSAVDYLLKPIQENQLIEATEKVRSEVNTTDQINQWLALSQNLQKDKNKVLAIPIKGGYEYIPMNEIEYLEADGSYVQIYCDKGQCKTVSKNLKYFENALADCSNFIRPHRSFLVNLDYVTNLSKSEGGYLLLKRNVQIPISRDRKEAIHKLKPAIHKF